VNWEAVGAIGEIAGALAVVVSLVYLARQVGMSNRLARAEAFRAPNSDLNSMNAAFGIDPIFRAAIRQVLSGARRDELEPGERIFIDYYLISITNIYEQLAREVREGVLDPNALDFGGKGLFLLPYYRTSWPLYRDYLSSTFVDDFEKQYELDPSIEAIW
jgi:hypothetical protein